MKKLIGVKGRPLTEDELKVRIYARVEQSSSDSCWKWLGPISKDGYAKQGVRYVHRLVYKWHYGVEADVVDHLCRNRSCQNPLHMESVTRAENTRRGGVKPITELCVNGHSWLPDNLYTTSCGHRKCRACRREGMRKHHGTS